ncbi:RNA-binding protein [Candidatus Woesearchaeota archaeon]|nr:RNA-binding protein [Candidatus Woesearchaeota archaeon]
MKKQLSKHEREEFQERIAPFLTLDKKDSVEDAGKRWLVNNQSAFIEIDGTLIPHLRFLLTKPLLKQVVVDMGAVKFVTSGADIMRPGIKEFAAGIMKDELVVVVDLNNKKPLAVGRMLFSGEEAQAMDKGKVIKNLHWVGDEFWNA